MSVSEAMETMASMYMNAMDKSTQEGIGYVCP